MVTDKKANSFASNMPHPLMKLNVTRIRRSQTRQCNLFYGTTQLPELPPEFQHRISNHVEKALRYESDTSTFGRIGKGKQPSSPPGRTRLRASGSGFESSLSSHLNSTLCVNYCSRAV
jgi:hypothetical protein